MDQSRPVVSIRRAAPGDLRSIANLQVGAMQTLSHLAPEGYGNALRALPAERNVAAQFAELVNDDSAILLLGETDGQPSGFLLGVIEEHGDDLLDAPFLTVQYLAVAAEYRKRGIAEQLMCAIEAEAAKRGIKTIDLLVWDCNAAACALYTRCGYTTLERRMVKRLL